MKKIFLIIFSFLILIIGCDSTNEPISEIPESFYKKVDNNLQSTLINLYNEVRENKKSNIELSNKYSSELMPVDTLLRVLVAVRTNDKLVKNDFAALNCELKNEGKVDLYYWIPILNFMKVTELEKVLSIFSKGVSITH